MQNPFEDIVKRLEAIEQLLSIAVKQGTPERQDDEYLTEEQVCKRFGITRPTIRKWSKEHKIKVLRFGTSKRYNWQELLLKLEKQKV